MPRVLAVCLPLLLTLPAFAADPAPDTSRGDKMIRAYFKRQVQQIADAALADVKTKADWEKKRPEMHRQFMEMLGLDPLPPRTDLKATITGKVETDYFTVEKLHFQSIPGLYVTGNLYLPRKGKGPFPAVLYVCGHANTVVDKVSYGSKVNYQYHPAWFAEHGYACLVLDTLQLGEIEGIHHGLYRHGMWWWQTIGYTPAGIECWNGIRALDYLQSRKEVDPKRLGVTGRSGGGATSWWIGAADERVKCIVPVAGIADLRAHVVEGVAPRLRDGVITGHCDCMYFVNTYRWDFSQVIALCAPRAVLLGNSDADDIFPVAGYRRLADKVRPIFALYDAADHFQLLETKGPHKDSPELRQGINQWMNRWLKDDKSEVTEPERPRLEPKQLKVFGKLPADAINTIVHERFIKVARPELPNSAEVAKEWWKGKAPEWNDALKEKVFRGWTSTPPDLRVRPAEDVKHDGLRLRAYDFVSEDEIELRVWVLTADKVDKPTLVVLNALDEAGWKEWCADLGPAFTKALQLSAEPKLDEAKFTQNRKALEKFKWAFAAVTPRGIGPTRWNETGADGKPTVGVQIRRRYGLIGQTLDGQRVWDVRRAAQAIKTVADLKEAPLWMQGKGDMAGIALYAALFEPDVARLDLWHPPASHFTGPIFLNVRRTLDMPQAMAMAFPRKVMLYVKDDTEAKAWEWPLQLQRTLGQEYLKIRKVGDDTK
jgi:cephalosporin-C deacetylase-like acetyl esterase